MGMIIKNYEDVKLPEEIIEKLRGKDIEIIETEDGILFKLLHDSIKETRGCLKGSHFTTQRYMQLKRKEKDLEQ